MFWQNTARLPPPPPPLPHSHEGFFADGVAGTFFLPSVCLVEGSLSQMVLKASQKDTHFEDHPAQINVKAFVTPLSEWHSGLVEDPAVPQQGLDDAHRSAPALLEIPRRRDEGLWRSPGDVLGGVKVTG